MVHTLVLPKPHLLHSVAPLLILPPSPQASQMFSTTVTAKSTIWQLVMVLNRADQLTPSSQES